MATAADRSTGRRKAGSSSSAISPVACGPQALHLGGVGLRRDLVGVLVQALAEEEALQVVLVVAGLEVAPDELGEGGAGPVELLLLLLPALEDGLVRPDAGTLRVAGIDVARQPEQVRRATGPAGQSAAVEPALTGRENLRMALGSGAPGAALDR